MTASPLKEPGRPGKEPGKKPVPKAGPRGPQAGKPAVAKLAQGKTLGKPPGPRQGQNKGQAAAKRGPDDAAKGASPPGQALPKAKLEPPGRGGDERKAPRVVEPPHPGLMAAATASATEAAATVRAQRKHRARRLALRAVLGVGVPTLLGAIYYFGIASSRYQSESLFMVQSAEARQAIGLETLIGAVPGGAAMRDTLAVRDFILSRDMLQLLEKEYHFRERFQSPSIDWISRLAADATFEDAYEYYEHVVSVDHDSNSGVLTLRVRAFSPEYSQQLSRSILQQGEKMVNQLSERARVDQTKLARAEVKSAEQRLTKARQVIVKLQQEHSEFSPQASATEAMNLRSQLQGELANARAELMQAKAFMQPNAPRVVALNSRVQSLSAQVSQESRRLVNPGAEKGLNTTFAKFDEAMIEKEFAQSAYESALASLEVARTEASRQHRYLATIARPSIADEETHPKRFRAVLTIFVLSVMLFGIGSLLVATVREHARV